MKISEKVPLNHILFLCLMVFLSFFVSLGNVPLFDLDEGAFSEATREMLLNGDYITTYLNGDLRFDKPILIYWCQAISVTLFGLNEFALRLPSALSATIWVMAIYMFTRQFLDIRRAFFAAFFMMVSIQVTVIAKAAIADALLNMCLALTMFGIYRYFFFRTKKYIYFAYLFMGLGVLTKGPVAILIPFAVSLCFFAIKKELRIWMGAVMNPIGLMIFLLIAAPWYIAEYIAQGHAFIDGFIFNHNINRFKTSFEGHGGSILYYIPIVLGGVLPNTTLCLKALSQVKNLIKDEMPLFSLIWFFFVFFFFSLSGTKLPHYVIYGYTPMFILMAMCIDKVKNDFLLFLPPLLLVIILFFLPEIFGNVEALIKDEFARIVMSESIHYFDVSYRFILGIAIIGFLALSFYKKLNRPVKLILSGLMIVAIVNLKVLPIVARVQQVPIKEAAMIAKEEDYDVVMWNLNTPSFIVYQGKLVQKRKPKDGDIVLTKVNKLSKIEDYRVIYQKNGIVMVEVIRAK